MRDISGHTPTVDQIVDRVLRLWNPDDPVHEGAWTDDVESLLGYDLDEVETAIDRAKKKEQGDDVLHPLESRQMQIRDRLETGASIRRDLWSEIEAYRQDQNKTTLVVIIQMNEGDIYESEDVRVTTKSAYQWVKNNYQIEITEWGPAQRTVPELEDTLKNARKFTNLERDKYLITIAGLLDLIAKKQSGRYAENGTPNRKYIGEQVQQILDKAGVTQSGFSAETLRGRFSDAIKAKKEHSEPQK